MLGDFAIFTLCFLIELNNKNNNKINTDVSTFFYGHHQNLYGVAIDMILEFRMLIHHPQIHPWCATKRDILM